jgi:glucose-6-phosphate dehydrogenase assembly protein OpcA
MAATMSGAHGDLQTKPVVDVHAIEEELAEVRWKLKPDGEVGEAEIHAAAEARASVLNLITVVDSESEYRAVAEVLDELAINHPSRTLVLLAQESRAALKLEANVVAEAHLTAGHRVVTEQVLIHAHGPIAAHLASLVTPLLIPDLPVMLWWPGRPEFESRLFLELSDVCDRLVVDTDDGFEAADLARLLQVSRRRRHGCAIGDFNWARLLPWRELATQFFDLPSTRARLAGLHGVTVWYGADGPATQALLLAGWVESRMASVGIAVGRVIRPDPAVPPGVGGLMLYSDGPDGRSRFSITRLRGSRLSTEMRIGEEDVGGRTVRLEQRSAADLLAIELMLPGHDRVYEEALEAAAHG